MPILSRMILSEEVVHPKMPRAISGLENDNASYYFRILSHCKGPGLQESVWAKRLQNEASMKLLLFRSNLVKTEDCLAQKPLDNVGLRRNLGCWTLVHMVSLSWCNCHSDLISISACAS